MFSLQRSFFIVVKAYYLKHCSRVCHEYLSHLSHFNYTLPIIQVKKWYAPEAHYQGWLDQGIYDFFSDVLDKCLQNCFKLRLTFRISAWSIKKNTGSVGTCTLDSFHPILDNFFSYFSVKCSIKMQKILTRAGVTKCWMLWFCMHIFFLHICTVVSETRCCKTALLLLSDIMVP